MQRKLKFAIYHLYLLNGTLKQIDDSIDRVTTSSIGDGSPEHLQIILSLFAELIVLKSVSYIKEWRSIKSLIEDRYLVEDIENVVGLIIERWPQIIDFRDEVVGHAFGRLVNGSRNHKESIFSENNFVIYDIPATTEDFRAIILRIFECQANIAAAFPTWIYEYEAKLFPVAKT